MNPICLVFSWAWIVPGSIMPLSSMGSGGSTPLAAEFRPSVVVPPLPGGAGSVLDSTDVGYAGPSYLDVAYQLCVARCTPDVFLAGVGLGFSLVYPQTRVLYGAYVGGCLAGCFAAYTSRW